MGAVRLYECSCGYKKELCVGCGMFGMNLNLIENTVPAEMFEEFRREKDAGRVKNYIIGNAVLSCPDCKELSAVSDFLCETESGRMRFTLPCPDCGRQTEPIDEINEVPCPKCGKKMNFSETGHWD